MSEMYLMSCPTPRQESWSRQTCGCTIHVQAQELVGRLAAAEHKAHEQALQLHTAQSASVCGSAPEECSPVNQRGGTPQCTLTTAAEPTPSDAAQAKHHVSSTCTYSCVVATSTCTAHGKAALKKTQTMHIGDHKARMLPHLIDLVIAGSGRLD